MVCHLSQRLGLPSAELATQGRERGTSLRCSFPLLPSTHSKAQHSVDYLPWPPLGGVVFLYMCTVKIFAGIELLGLCHSSLHPMPGLGKAPQEADAQAPNFFLPPERERVDCPELALEFPFCSEKYTDTSFFLFISPFFPHCISLESVQAGFALCIFLL